MLGVGLGLASPAVLRRKGFLPLDLGPSIMAWWDASSGVSLSGSEVTSWTDRKGGYVASQGTSANRPTYSATGFNGAPGLTFDGTNDELTLASQPFPSGAAGVEIWAVVSQDALGTSAGSRYLFSYGGSTNNDLRTLQRTTSSNVNRFGALVGTGASASSIGTTASAFDGRVLARARITATTTYVSLDGGAEFSASIVPATGTTRVRIGAAGYNAPLAFWQGKVRDIIVTGALSAGQASDLQTFLLARRML